MKSLCIEEKIKKSIKCIMKKFNRAVIEVKIVEEDSVYIEVDNGNYNIINNYNDKCHGILIIQNGENNFYQFKDVLKNVQKYFNGNGLVFIRYEDSICDSVDYVENQFMTYLKLNKFKDIEEYILLSDSGKESGVFITASYHIDLLDKEDEYESYTPNFILPKKSGGCCGGCEKKSCGSGKGCSDRSCGCSGECSSCNKGCN